MELGKHMAAADDDILNGTKYGNKSIRMSLYPVEAKKAYIDRDMCDRKRYKLFEFIFIYIFS